MARATKLSRMLIASVRCPWAAEASNSSSSEGVPVTAATAGARAWTPAGWGGFSGITRTVAGAAMGATATLGFHFHVHRREFQHQRRRFGRADAQLLLREAKVVLAALFECCRRDFQHDDQVALLRGVGWIGSDDRGQHDVDRRRSSVTACSRGATLASLDLDRYPSRPWVARSHASSAAAPAPIRSDARG